MINLAAGLVDPLTLPVRECDAIARRLHHTRDSPE